jgi:hypothetical protein
MRARVVQVMALAVLVSAATTACNSSFTTCWNGVCTAKVRGAPRLEVEVGFSSIEQRVQVVSIGPTAVTVEEGGRTATLSVGQSAVLDDVEILLEALDGTEATLRISAAA